MGKIDWNKVAYNVGQMAGDGVNKANDLIDAGERKVRQSIEKYKQTRAEAGQIMYTTQPDTSYSHQGHTGGSIDMEEMKDAQDRIKGWFGPNRVVKIDMSDGSFAYYKIHDTQRTEDAVLVMSQILINRLKALAPKTDLINAQDPHEEDVRVIITIDKSSLETGSPSYDDRTCEVHEGGVNGDVDIVGLIMKELLICGYIEVQYAQFNDAYENYRETNNCSLDEDDVTAVKVLRWDAADMYEVSIDRNKLVIERISNDEMADIVKKF